VRHPDTTTALQSTRDALPYDEAVKIRALFCVDQSTRRAVGGPPYTEDILKELDNRVNFDAGLLDTARQRIRLGKAIYSQNGELVAYLGVTVVHQASLLPYDRTYVWGGKGPLCDDGVFIRRFIVKNTERRNGYGILLLKEARNLSEKFAKHLYADTKADNIPMCQLAVKAGGSPNMFWFTPKGTLMVRYIWI